MIRKRVVVIEGEDAAPEAMVPSVALLEGLGLPIEWLRPPLGQRGIEATGSPFPEEARHAIDASDATFFGATSGKSAPALLYLRWGKRTFANARPVRWFPGCRCGRSRSSASEWAGWRCMRGAPPSRPRQRRRCRRSCHRSRWCWIRS